MARVACGCGLLLALLVAGCGGSDAPTAPSLIAAPIASATASPTVGAEPPATPRSVTWDLRVTHLTIAALEIDTEVSRSQRIPDASVPPPGCDPPPAGQETLTVPADGIATPEEALAGLEHKAWIFGHSRWQAQPGLFHALQDIAIGDEILVDGVDRRTDEQLIRQRFVVEGIYLADKESGADLVTADVAAEIPATPTLILQTSVREAGRTNWLLDRGSVLARAHNLVDGDLEDPCKYLLLFVIARAA